MTIDQAPAALPPSFTADAPSIYALLRGAAEWNPGGTALTFLELADLDMPDFAPQRLTHRQLLRQIHQAANAFHRAGAGPSSVISLLAPSIPEAMVALWAAETAGIANPINFLLRSEDIVEILRTAGTEILVTLGPHPRLDIWQKVAAARDQVPSLKAVFTIGPADPQGTPSLRGAMRAEEAEGLAGGRVIAPGDTAAYFHTGGTTGRPKLAAQTHANQVFTALALAWAWGYGRGTRIVNGLPFFHVAGSLLLALSPLAAGAEVILPTAAGMRNPELVARHWEMVEACRPTIIGGIPTSLVALLDVPAGRADLRAIDFCATGGAPLPQAVAEAFTQRFGLPVLGIYGMTECSGLIAVAPRDRPPRYDSVGFHIPGTELEARRLRPDGSVGERLPAGETGVLVVRGPHVFPGYLDPAQTAAAFTADGWLITGDVGAVDADGRTRITGRSKDVIIRGGHNIDPTLIEEAADTHPAVSQSAAVGMPDLYTGEVPILYVTARPGAALSPGDLDAHLRRTIAEDRARPAEIVLLDALPMTPMGKISKLALRRDAARRAVEIAIASPARSLGIAAAAEMTEDATGRATAVVAVRGCPEGQRDAAAAAIGKALAPFAFPSSTRFE